VERADLDSVLAQLFDRELLFHGFTPYMRDYELVVYESADPNPKYGLVPLPWRDARKQGKLCWGRPATSDTHWCLEPAD
jgi:hypothetical protein